MESAVDATWRQRAAHTSRWTPENGAMLAGNNDGLILSYQYVLLLKRKQYIRKDLQSLQMLEVLNFLLDF